MFDKPPGTPGAPGQWRDVLQRNEQLRRNAAPIMETLHEEIARPNAMVVLTDDTGLILHTQGQAEFLAKAEIRARRSPPEGQARHQPPLDVPPSQAIGARLQIPEALKASVQAGHALTASASPILGPDGRLAGVLDVTGDRRGLQQRAMGLVRLSATMIENKLVLGSAHSGYRVRFHRAAASIKTLAEGIVIFDADGLLVSVNRVARTQFGIDGQQRHRQSFADVFGASLGRTLIANRGGQPVPVSLQVNGEVPVYALVEPIQGAWLSFPRTSRASNLMEDFAPVSGSRSAEPLPLVEPIAAKPLALASTAAIDRLDTGDLRVHEVLSRVRKLVSRQPPTLILGEAGTGKEWLARAIHLASPRCGGPFVAVNCAAAPESQIASDLFGHVQDVHARIQAASDPGRIQQANGGTLFLDEIGDMPLSLQARLLSVLQEGAVRHAGSNGREPVDVMLVCATHQDLEALIRAQQFRQDLLYHINTLTLRLPALRERTDLAGLVDSVLRHQCHWHQGVSERLLRVFQAHPWPGNLRELSNLLPAMVALAQGDRALDIGDLPDPAAFLGSLDGLPRNTPWRPPVAALPSPQAAAAAALPPLTMDMNGIAEAAIEQALLRCNGNVSAAAKELGISRNTIYRRRQRGSGGPKA